MVKAFLSPVYSPFRLLLGAIFVIISFVTTYFSFPSDVPPQTGVQYTKIPKGVWILYSGTFGNPENDSRWIHWRYPKGEYSNDWYEPPLNVPSLTYPQLGLYSSHDESVIRTHCQQISEAGIEAIILCWWGKNSTDRFLDDTDGYSDKTMELLLKIAPEFKLKVGIQIQPHQKRNATVVVEEIQYILDKYATNPNYLTVNKRPVIIIYEFFSIKDAKLTCNQFKNNPYIIGSVTQKSDIASNLENCMEAMFTYFAAIDTTWSSKTKEWEGVSKDVRSRGLAFIPGIGPGHDRGKVDHWNKAERSRESGKYYRDRWEDAIRVKADTIIINSFNNWVDNSHIEPAVNRSGFEFSHRSWAEANNPDLYLEITRNYSVKYLYS
ncbi:glycoprotein endo-alpha-1,2-mannosidase, putative [Trichomonas vaginalis G3]|uniref:Glycoprotein endo-alpha-1,2-mannosidase, putative n=1 Tax=Trichomonas vaginalis (strain ATCC PRA-98 / G3) TaxID=412133 RepID=A2EWP6_TRIV3|nr:glycoprotein endo-alpha-1,2-mannosidase-like family [Trichomonas vaginalis G3]EAY02934.1 glycoprotein endo-alpha-1,2-mannosidase, putative [Trichomonas vaginalis G3]KAI5521784.1 glycoprotein endo-alpha-1,2-mannosidase-like family [Trichomonas vaginalis G3]|eukprot:XP_001315157.1 glycoprotein endo-alpha-1,2-mannosidase [Trichomonas vaginalis G3]